MAALNLKSVAAYLGTAEASAALASTVVDAADAAADAGPLVVFYTYLPTRTGLAYWLSKSPEFKRSYPRVRFIAVHDLVDRRGRTSRRLKKPCSAPAPWSSTSRSARSTGVSPRRSPAPGRCSVKKRSASASGTCTTSAAFRFT